MTWTVLVDTPTQASLNLLRMFKGAGKPAPVLFDIETTGLNPRTDKFVALIFRKWKSGECLIVDMRRSDNWPAGVWVDALGWLFDDSRLIVGHNLKFDLSFMRHHFGLRLFRVFDTQLAEQVIKGEGLGGKNSGGNGFSLKAIVHRRLGIEMSKEERSWFIDLDTRPEWSERFPAEQVEYMENDVAWLEPIMLAQQEELRKFKLTEVARLEFDALQAFVHIELSGMKFDKPCWNELMERKRQEADQLADELSKTFVPLIAKAQAAEYDPKFRVWKEWHDAKEGTVRRAKELWGDQKGWNEEKKRVTEMFKKEYPEPKKPAKPPAINMGSPQQILMALNSLGVPVASTTSLALEPYKEQYPEVKLLEDYRTANKLPTTYGKIPDMACVDGRVHGTINQIGATTGRSSGKAPNIQNIPARSEEGKLLRGMVIAEDGWKIVVADFPNIELRILCHLAQDQNMLRLFNENADLHSATARFMFNLPEGYDCKKNKVPGLDLSYRDIAKTINFGLMYGMSPRKLAGILKCGIEEAREVLDRYWSFYPSIRQWLAESNELVLREMKARTVLGRWRKFVLPEAPGRIVGESWEDYERRVSEWRGLRASIQRMGTNMRVQGESADMTKDALARFERRVESHWKLDLVVHDEIGAEVPDDEAEECAARLGRSMEEAMGRFLTGMVIPKVEPTISDHWSK